MKLQLPDHIASVIPHEPCISKKELKREQGISDSINLASNENPWGSSPKVIRALRSVLSKQHQYPDDSGFTLRKRLAENVNLTIDEIVLGNGSAEIVQLLLKSFVREGEEVISSHPSSRIYQQFVQVHGGENFAVPLKKYHHDLEAILLCVTEQTRLIVLDNPNNPTGSVINPGELYSFLSKVPETVIVVLDETYIDFVDNEFQVDIFSLIRNNSGRCGVVVIRSFSHAYGLAGLRVGYGLMPAEISDCLHRVRQPFNVNMMAQVGAQAALEDDAYYQNVLKMNGEGRDFLLSGIEKTGCRAYPSQANFLLIDIKGDGIKLYNAMLQKGIIVCPMEHFGLPDCIRVSVGTEKDNLQFLEVFSECIKSLGYV